MPSVLFICSGNICRSPMAEAIFRSILQKRGVDQDWHVSSAGTLDLPSSPASLEARQAMAEEGIDLRKHRSRPVTVEMLEASDLVLVMTGDHLSLINEASPHLLERTFLLAQMTGAWADVEDPIGYDLPVYRECARQIRNYLEGGLETITGLAARQAAARLV